MGLSRPIITDNSGVASLILCKHNASITQYGIYKFIGLYEIFSKLKKHGDIKNTKVWFNNASYVHTIAKATIVRAGFLMLWPRIIRLFPAGIIHTVWYLPRSLWWQLLFLPIAWDTIPSTLSFGVNIFGSVRLLVMVLGWMFCGIGCHATIQGDW